MLRMNMDRGLVSKKDEQAKYMSNVLMPSFASFSHSKIGVVEARSLFAFLQSAGMKGYGYSSVNKAFRFAAAAINFGAKVVWECARGNRTA